jgi:hypothetical protein
MAGPIAGHSSMRIYREEKLAGGSSTPIPRIETPVGYAVFPKEVIASPDRWIEAGYNIVHKTMMPKGGHFAALEQPDLLIKGHPNILCEARTVVVLGLAHSD